MHLRNTQMNVITHSVADIQKKMSNDFLKGHETSQLESRKEC